MQLTPEEIERRDTQQKENQTITTEVTEKLWGELMERTKEMPAARRFIIFSRVTAFMVANVYMPAVEMVTDSQMDELTKLQKGEIK